jgi:hypothetical protein
MNKNFKTLFLLNLILTPVLIFKISDLFAVSSFGNFTLWIGYLFLAFFSGTALFLPESIGLTPTSKVPSVFNSLKVIFFIALFLVLIPYKPSVKVYNQSVAYTNFYNQKCNERALFYENLWVTYKEKNDILNLNKTVFVDVAKMILESRKDGANVSWKFLHENSGITFSDFSSFYSDLSSFIQTKRSEYLAIENQCQAIATANNTMLDTFPNNVYNLYLGRKHIDNKFTSVIVDTKYSQLQK